MQSPVLNASSEQIVRLSCFLGVFAVMAIWELLAARRERVIPRWRRWPNNLGVVLIDTLAARLVAPSGAVGFAILAEAKGWGLFHLITMPDWLELSLAVAILDLGIYFQHRAFHRLPALWRFHLMHHSDLDLDVTSGARFHPVEILISLGIKFLLITILGASALSVFVFEILLNATAMFNHSNVRIPERLERALRCFLVTPDMHRVHHSILQRETDSNFGFNLPWWDCLFRTYRAAPEAGHQRMCLGLPQFRDPKELRLDRMLTQPIRLDPHP